MFALVFYAEQQSLAQNSESSSPAKPDAGARSTELARFVPAGSLYAVQLNQSALERTSLGREIHFEGFLLETFLSETTIREVWRHVDQLIVIAFPEALDTQSASAPPALIVKFRTQPPAAWMPRTASGEPNHATWKGRDYYRPAGDESICTCLIDADTILLGREEELRAMIDAESSESKIGSELAKLQASNEVAAILDTANIPQSFHDELNEGNAGKPMSYYETQFILTILDITKYAELVRVAIRFDEVPRMSIRFTCHSKREARWLGNTVNNLVKGMREETLGRAEKQFEVEASQLTEQQRQQVRNGLNAMRLIFEAMAPAQEENEAVIQVSGRGEFSGVLALTLPAVAGMQKAARESRAKLSKRAKGVAPTVDLPK